MKNIGIKLVVATPGWRIEFLTEISNSPPFWINDLRRLIGRSPVEIKHSKQTCLLHQVLSDCLSMCPCRPCSEIRSILDWNIKGCEARPMMTCWMNLWRLCQRGKIILALRSPTAHRLWAGGCWHVNGDSTWCYWEKNVKQFSTVPACKESQNLCNWTLWISSPDNGLVSFNSGC